MNLLTPQDKRELLKLRPFFRLNIVFPHVVNNMLLRWGTLQFSNYMEDLFLDNRGNTRIGFPEEALKDLYRIMDYHNKLFSEFLEEINVSDVNLIWN
jgi:hypothetical protein